MNNTVTCNYYFYNTEGSAMEYPYEITVSAILPGGKDVYIYRKFGSETITSATKRTDLVEDGYSESTEFQRNDTILINKASSKQYVEVPMSYFNRVDTLLFRYSNISLPDTIYLEHESYAHVDIPECGSYRYHNIVSIKSTENAIDHLEITNSTVNYDQEQNVKIYFNSIANQ